MALVEAPETFQLFINGEDRPASDGATVEIKSPATREVIATIAAATVDDVDETAKIAHKAFKEWAALSAYKRESIIKAATAHVRTCADRIGRLMALEQGKPFAQSRKEVIASCDTIDYYAAEGVRVEGYTNQTESATFRSTVIYQPVGVAALITPWNYPVSLLSWKLGPALAAGCSMVVKPTTVTPLCSTEFCRELTKGGIPAGVINVLTGSGRVVGENLVKHPLIKKVGMTGSTATGKRLMEVFGPSLGKITLELGGHCPAIVCADGDPKLAAKMIAYKGFKNMGQSCSSINRVFAHSSIHDEVVAELKKIAESQSIGDGVTDGGVDLGPMATADGPETSQEHVDDAVAKGATLVYGGKKPEGEQYTDGFYYLPTILTGATKDMKVMNDETFGPVVPFVKFDDLDDAIAQANDTSYGLVAYAFTKDYTTTVKVTEELEAGTVCVNHGAVNTNYAPYCGWKDSGFGTELSRRAIYEYLNTKHIKVQLS